MADWKDIHLVEKNKRIAELEAENARLRQERDGAYERAAKVADEEAETHLSCAAHARDTENEASYDRCMARYKTAFRIAMTIREFKGRP